MRRVFKTAQVESDLIGIWQYTFDHWGAAKADEYLEDLEKGMSGLGDNASTGFDRGNVRDGYRVLLVHRHAVYYRTSDTVIQIIRVLHGRMDPEAHFRRRLAIVGSD